MVVGEASINNIMSGIENTGGVKQHNHKKKLKQRFDIIKKLGQGTFGKVQLGINKETGQEVAIKTIKKSKIESEADLVRIRREIQIMSSVQHPNIIHIYEVFENREKMVLVMEYAAGGELYDYLSERKVLDEEEARRIFRQIATACYYCHKHKICHRDLKLENILLDENNNAKIADFGLSNVFDDQRLLSTFCGSPLYASPEIVKGTPYHGPEVDCWSLGVLLYTLVYGAMPFDGSNFKRLVKQISQGDYFEPAKPSPASPLIRDMLTVNPKYRASVEKICTHWWVNENSDSNCLDVSEELANQTPVRLDLLLSLAPPPPQLESDKLVVTDADDQQKTDNAQPPTRSQSVGSLMELTHPAERRIKDLMMMNEDRAVSAKRKLENVSSDRIREGMKRKDKIIKDNTIADITVHGAIREASVEDASMSESLSLDKSRTQTLLRDVDDVASSKSSEVEDPSSQGAACAELMQETNKVHVTNKEPVVEVSKNVNKENLDDKRRTVKTTAVPKKKVLADKNEIAEAAKRSEDVVCSEEVVPEVVTKPVERRKSRIFEVAEKFQSMIAPSDSSAGVASKAAPVEKPKKIVIPGVSVDGFKKEFERKASLTSTSPPKIKTAPSKKILIDQQQQKPDEVKDEPPATATNQEEPSPTARKDKVRTAVSIISSALDKDKDGTRKSKSRPCCVRKPPVPFGASGRSASGNIGMITPLSPPPGPKPFVRLSELEDAGKRSQSSEANKAVVMEEEKETQPEESKTSNAEITLKSATLPRRKTTKAEIHLNYPVPKPATMEFKTEMAHNVIVPPPSSSSVKSSSKERIIPIAFEKQQQQQQPEPIIQSPPPKPPMPRPFQAPGKIVDTNNQQRTGTGNTLSRQSTQDSDTETASTGEPIRKSPREYIIPIAVEGGGYVTPRGGSVEPSEVGSTGTLTGKRGGKFGRPLRLNSRMSDRDSEDENAHPNLHRHSSFGRDSDTEDSRNSFHLHRLRSSRPKKTILEHNDSFSSGEEDDDDGFEILTAENLFSNLLSRVRDLTQKLNVEDGGRPGFPTSRLLGHFDHGTNFWSNFHNRMDPLSRHSSLGRSLSRDRSSTPATESIPWRRSVSRDLASDIESVFKDPNTRPRGDVNKSIRKKTKENNSNNDNDLNLSHLDLNKLKLTDEDALALSYLTPALSKRIQKQLLAQLAPAEAKKLQRTMSSCNGTRDESHKIDLNPRRSVENASSNNDNVTPSRATRSLSLREPRNYSSRFINNDNGSTINNSNKSPESSLSETWSTKTDSSSKIPSSSSSTNTKRRISRFLRPDFYDSGLRENVVVKEKKEREMETQKILKEIRDKRKNRLRGDRAVDKSSDSSSALLEDVSQNIKNIENNTMHDYVNVKAASPLPDYVNVVKAEEPVVVVKKTSKISKLVRPKSYPTDDNNDTSPPTKASTTSSDKESRISRFRRGFTRHGSKDKDKDKEQSEEQPKNKLLLSIEKKLEKFRTSDDKKSGVESAIKRLREQSLPRNLDHCTESGLIQRAVSVEDLSNLNGNPKTKPHLLQTSRKSVTKILGLFKKYEEPHDSASNNGNTAKKTRPRSLTLDKHTGESDNNGNKNKASKLPVVFRRSLNLETEPSNVKRQSSTVTEDNNNRNSIADDSSLLSPGEASDSWSVCSGSSNNHTALTSPVSSPNGGGGGSHVFYNHYNPTSGDESESVIDRIRRKSFYTRFNEKKRKPSLRNNLDLYSPSSTNGNYDRRSYDSNLSYLQPQKREYRPYGGSHSVLMANDYVNVPSRYQTYSSKIGRPSVASDVSGGCSSASLGGYGDVEDSGGTTTLDELLSAAKSRKYSSLQQPSLSRKSSSAFGGGEHFYNNNNYSNNNTFSRSNRATPSRISPSSPEP